MNKKVLITFCLIILILTFPQFISSNEHDPEQNNHQTNQKNSTQNIVESMNLNQKIGQLIISGITGSDFDKQTSQLINQYHVGGLIFYKNNLANSTQASKLINKIKKTNESNQLPLFLGVDQEGGRITRLPGNLHEIPTMKQIGKVDNEQFSYEIGSLLGQQLNEFGLNINFAPVLDINNNPNNPVIGDRSFGSTPNIVSKHGIEVMKGIKSQHIIPVIKHFPGHGDTSTDSHLQLPIINKSIEALSNFELIPFKKAIQNGVDAVMVAHILLPKIDEQYPSSMSKLVITNILRNQLKFNGVVITDDMTMKAITDHYELGQAAVKSIQAGSDVIMVAHGYDNVVNTFNAIKTAVEKGDITEERINKSVSRIIKLKRKYNLENKKVNEPNTNLLNKNINYILNKYLEEKGN